jgi:hypothetical protein
MATKFHWLAGVVLVAGGLAASSPSIAQATRPWVDPPAENGMPSSGSSPSSSPAPAEVKPATSALPPAAAKVEEADKPDMQQASETVDKPAAKPAPKKTVAERKARKPAVEADGSARSSKKRAVASSNGSSRQAARLTREERVRRGLDSGLELMTLRTIEYPDGRRVQILTRPSPGAMSEMLEVRR